MARRAVEVSQLGYEGRFAGRAAARVAAGSAAHLRTAGMLGAVTAGVVGAYLPVAVVPYAFSDDYGQFLGGFHGLWSTAMGSGRPLYSVVTWATFGPIDHIDELRVVRLLTLLATLALAFLLRAALARAGFGGWGSVLAAVLVVASPSFQVYTAWAVLVEAPIAALLGGAASVVLERTETASPRRLAVAAALLLAGLLMYQPAAMFFWVFAAIAFLRPGPGQSRRLRSVATHAAVGVVSLVVAYATLRIATHVHPSWATGRSALLRHPLSKADWFVTKPLYGSLSLVTLRPNLAIAVVVALTIVVGNVFLRRGSPREKLVLTAVGVSLLVLAYLPNLAVRENLATFRTQGALRAIVVVYFAGGLREIARAARAGIESGSLARLARPAAAVGTVFATAAVIGAVLLAARHVTTLFVKPQSAELALLRESVPRRLPPGLVRVTYIRAQASDSPAPVVACDEFGLPSSYQYWVPSAAVALALRDERQTPRTFDVRIEPAAAIGPPTEVRSHGYTKSGVPTRLVLDVVPPTGAAQPRGITIDMRRLRTISDGWAVWTLHKQGLHRTSAPRRPTLLAC